MVITPINSGEPLQTGYKPTKLVLIPTSGFLYGSQPGYAEGVPQTTGACREHGPAENLVRSGRGQCDNRETVQIESSVSGFPKTLVGCLELLGKAGRQDLGRSIVGRQDVEKIEL